MEDTNKKLNSQGLFLTPEALSFLFEENPSASPTQLWEKALEVRTQFLIFFLHDF